MPVGQSCSLSKKLHHLSQSYPDPRILTSELLWTRLCEWLMQTHSPFHCPDTVNPAPGIEHAVLMCARMIRKSVPLRLAWCLQTSPGPSKWSRHCRPTCRRCRLRMCCSRCTTSPRSALSPVHGPVHAWQPVQLTLHPDMQSRADLATDSCRTARQAGDGHEKPGQTSAILILQNIGAGRCGL